MKLRYGTMVITLSLLAASCGADPEQEAQRATTSQNTVDDTDASADQPEPDGDAEPDRAADEESEDGDDDAEVVRLPTSPDPCTAPPSLSKDGFVEYQMELVGLDRPVGVRVGSQAALDGGLLLLVFHGASQGWRDFIWAANLTPTLSAEWPIGQQIAVLPQAEPDTPAFWSETEVFNIEYMNELFEALSHTFCFDQLDVMALSAGQGSFALSQSMCEASLPVELHVMMAGLNKIAECTQPPDVPLISIDQFDFHPTVGGSWDSSWNPPVAFEQRVMGGSQPTPEDLAVWAQQYGCTDQPVETLYTEDLPRRLDRIPISLSYTDCSAPLLAFGLPTHALGTGVDLQVLGLVRPVIDEAVLAAFGRE